MKKLLFIFTLAAICTIATSSFNTAQSANDGINQIFTVATDNSVNAPEDVKKEDKKKKQTATTSCCPAKTQKSECTEAQQKKCAEAKTTCTVEKKCTKK